MSSFNVTIKKVRAIEPHPNADAIEFVVIDGYRSIAKKGEFQAGDAIAYIPESAVLPEWLLKRLGLWDAAKNCGKLSGKDGNRVKAIRLRGEISQGVCYPVARRNDALYINVDQDACGAPELEVNEGDDVAQLLGITKYEPPIPVAMAGEVFNAGQKLTLSFDVENWKSFPDVLVEGEEVVFTEKIHGTCTVVAILPYKDAHPEAFGEKKNILVFSKGLGAKGLVFKNNERNRDNLYVRATRKLIERTDELQRDNPDGGTEPNFILGETFGPGVQDLTYGKEIGFRVFAAARGYRGNQQYAKWSFVEGALKDHFGFETVPVLYRGPFSLAAMRQYTDGNTTLGAGHIREGIVMTPATERYDPKIGRVCLKSVSADYLVRKGATEYN
jgi:RNA ligase (TIGR02306 family)